ncbi:MAG: transcriptional repressor [Planctomycetes bacterium]|nr:transcriptional repressor [Planctomycetota bacterium]
MPKTKPDPIEQRLEHIKAAVREAGIKLTHQRLEIFRELAATEEHPDAEAIFEAVRERVPTVSLDTVYRTLWLLHDLGLVRTMGQQSRGIRFDANLDPHHHYVCVRCGLIRDFTSDELNRLHVPGSVKRLGSILDAHVEVRGLCDKCQRAKKANKLPKQRSTP